MCVHVLVQVCVYLQNVPGTCMLYLEELEHVPVCEKEREKIICFCGKQSKGRMETIAVTQQSGA